MHIVAEYDRETDRNKQFTNHFFNYFKQITK